MAKECFLCGKSAVAGRHIQHHHSIGWRFKAPRKTRQFKPNMRNVDIEIDGKMTKVPVCMKCYKRLRNKESAV